MAAKHPGAFAKKVFYGVTAAGGRLNCRQDRQLVHGSPSISPLRGLSRRTAGAWPLPARPSRLPTTGDPSGGSAVIRLPFAMLPARTKTYPECRLHCDSEGAVSSRTTRSLGSQDERKNVAAFVTEPSRRARLHHPPRSTDALAEIAAG